MTTINYVNGDATKPIGDDHKIIIHVVNDIRVWGAGFVLALSKRWMRPEDTFRASILKLGDIQIVSVEPDVTVINMVGQTGIGFRSALPPIRYGAVRECLQKVADHAKTLSASIHAPRFGAGLAGGDWNTIEHLIKTELCEKDIDVTIYDFGG